MTLPYERAHSIINMGNDVAALAGYARAKNGNTIFAKVPIAVLQGLLMNLRHYPSVYDLEELAKSRPDILEIK